MEDKKVKLTIELIVHLLNQGYTVGKIARMTNNGEWTVRYLLRKHGCKRVVRWECPNFPAPEQGDRP
jgi:hypothetical protein